MILSILQTTQEHIQMDSTAPGESQSTKHNESV